MTTKALGNDARFEEIVPDHPGSYGFQFRIAMNRLRAGLLAIILGISLTVGAVPVEQCQILISPAATRLERFGAREAQRYIYLRTGKVPPVVQRDTLDPQASGAIIKVAGITGRIRGMKYKRADGRSVRPSDWTNPR